MKSHTVENQLVIPDRLTEWLSDHGFPEGTLHPLQGDVSTRRYLRITAQNNRCAILALHPPELLPSCGRFLQTSALLERSGVRVPEIYAVELESGWMLLEDLGDETLYSRAGRPWKKLLPLVEKAAELVEKIRTIPVEGVSSLSPPLDTDTLRAELEKTWSECLEPGRFVGTDAESGELTLALDRLCEKLGAEDPVACHRDFMARNLIPVDRGTGLAVVDHQDLRPGPGRYDLASLLNDSLFAPADIEAQILARYTGSAAEIASYHRAAAQRTLKAAGTFAAFARRGHPRHVPLIVPTLLRAQHHLKRVPECSDAMRQLTARWNLLLADTAD